jgi:hypothetical protein
MYVSLPPHVGGRHDIVTKVTAKAFGELVVWGFAMPHDQVTIKAECGINDHLPFARTENSGEPSRFARVHQKENRIMRIHQLLQLCYAVRSCRLSANTYRMTRHRNSHRMTGGMLYISSFTTRITYDGWENVFESLGCAFSLRLSTIKTIFKLEQRLPHRI